ncbi:MAG TPA: Gfo/Idh/MocA family oxidoreductase [Bryobacteraceae bacterium]|jgi:predicted dehydrogenase|nr:Gfo/Idh/MocA family oxidoreductase [Bryobacteraceae bacterium]
MQTRRSLLLSALATAAVASPAKTYRVAVIGHTGRGNYGHGIDTVWNAFSRMEVVGVSDPDEKGRIAAVARTRAKRSYADYREMLRKEKPDLVGIGPRWMDQRVEMVTAAAEAGAHIYMEKPFAQSLAEADRMVEVVRKNKVKLQLAHQMRTSPYVLRAKAMVDAGEIGVIQEARARGKEDRRAGGEDMMVLGSHVCDMLRYFLGNPMWVTAHVTHDGAEIGSSDVRQATEPIGPIAGNQVSAMFAYPAGVHGFFASRASDKTDPLRFGTWLYGSKGVLFLPNGIYPGGGLFVLRSPAWVPDAKHQWTTIEAKPDLASQGIDGSGHDIANALMVADLIRAVETDGKPCCNEEDGRWTIEMIHGVYQAQKAGNRVKLPLVDRAHPLAKL